MRYQLPEHLPLTWSSSSELRLGGNRFARAIPDHPGVHAVIDALRYGATREFLEALAKSQGMCGDEARELVTDVLDLCIPIAAGAAPRARVLVRTTPNTVDLARLVSQEFSRRGHQARIVGAEHTDHLRAATLTVEVGDYVLSPRRYLPLVSADTPHLALIRDHNCLHVGPLVVPGLTPCFRCDDLHRLAADTGWPAVATQLLEGAPAPLPDEVAWLGAIQVGLIGDHFLAGADEPPWSFTSRTVIHTVTGSVEVQPRSFHDGCGCQAPPGSATVPRSPADMTAATTAGRV